MTTKNAIPTNVADAKKTPPILDKIIQEAQKKAASRKRQTTKEKEKQREREREREREENGDSRSLFGDHQKRRNSSKSSSNQTKKMAEFQARLL
jgi:hypothetical protein